MAKNSRVLKTSPDNVWAVLSDGWLYPLWVVGATRMRDVDSNWPEVGSKLHHSVGVWPFMINDSTEVLETIAGKNLRVRARAWPTGSAEVNITLTKVRRGTRVEITETIAAGPARLLPDSFTDLGIKLRNIETLKRLAFVVENRQT